MRKRAVTPSIKALFVDFGNVCATLDSGRFTRRFAAHAKVDEKRLFSVLCGPDGKGYSPLFAAFECGEITPLSFYRAVVGALSCADRIDFQTFALMWTDIFKKTNAPLDRILGRVRCPKYLLSNTNALVFGRAIARMAIVRNNFPDPHQHVLSCKIGAMKPDPQIYRIALRQARVEAGEALFIDDLAENIAAWEALGGHGIIYHASNHSTAKLKKELRALGVLN